MAKAIRWQIPFVSLSGTQYRLDIYADNDGSWSGITQLRPGASPFVTDEDDDKNFFAPVRSHTGTIEICTDIPVQTLYPSGGLLSMEEIMPASNIDHPVQLVSISGTTETVEWQGFLSCEAYTQNYNGIPKNISIPVISVLEAMDSVEVDTEYVSGLVQARYHLYYTLTEMDRQCGMPNAFFANIYYSKGSANILTKYIDATILYNIKEYTNEESFSYVVSGLSCKEVLKRLCTYMGWVCREQGRNIYFLRLGDEFALYTQPLSYLGATAGLFFTRSTVDITTANMSALSWHGKGHKRSVSQGAKSVEVVANIEDYELSMELPEFPTENLLYGNTIIESYSQMDVAFSNMVELSYHELTVRETSGGYDLFVSGDADVEDAYSACVLNPSCDVLANYPRKTNGTAYALIRPIGGFFAKLNFSGGDNNWIDGLYLVTSNELGATTHAPVIYHQDSIMRYRLTNGTLRFKATAMTIMEDGTRIADFNGVAYIKLQFGGLYWNGASWQGTECFFAADFDDSPADADLGEYILEIPITAQQPLYGNIVLEVRGSIQGGNNHGTYIQPDYDLFFSELAVEYEEPEYVAENQRSENKYYRLLGTNFKEEQSISTDLASTLNNKPSPSLIMNDTSTAMRMLTYTLSGGSTEPRRPEVDLLNRMAAYFGAARQRVTLEVLHPTTAALSLLKYNGIGDGKKYLPLAESRDWKEETSTLTCFETNE